MVVRPKGAGKGKSNVPVQKPGQKIQIPSKAASKGAGKAKFKGKGKGKGNDRDGPKPEKRMDPSDDNGPFTKASFIKYHGEEMGNLLWEQAGDVLKMEAAEGKKKAPPPPPASKGKGKSPGGPYSKLSEKPSAAKLNNPFLAAEPAPSSRTEKGKGAKGGKSAGPAKGTGKSAKGTTSSATSVTKPGLKKDGKKGGGKGDSSAKPEKRKDPSDGRGPFTYASFIKYHGEEKGKQYWDEAGK